MSHRPGGLKVKAAGNRIYVKDFSGEIETGTVLALKGGRIDVRQGDSATGDELFLETALATAAPAVIFEDAYANAPGEPRVARRSTEVEAEFSLCGGPEGGTYRLELLDGGRLVRAGPVGLATIGFGQGIAVTPIQLITAISSFGNDGKMMKPRLVKALKDSNGKTVKTFAGNDGELFCLACSLAFSVKGGIPDMIAHNARKVSEAEVEELRKQLRPEASSAAAH